MERGHFESAKHLFEQTLTLVRNRGDRFLEANALLSLSWVSLQQEQFDDARDWAAAAYERSTAIKAVSIAQVALGNQGWLCYRLGEPEKALGLFEEAQKQAKQIGAITDQVRWLTTAGYVYLDARQYDSAQGSYLEALDLARKINGQEDILNALMSLALVSERTGKLEQAAILRRSDDYHGTRRRQPARSALPHAG